MPRRVVSMIDRLMIRVVPEGDCWRFTGAINAAGYGVIGRGSRASGNALTHRATYEHFVAPIPAGFDLDHLCRNRWCCNPAHLEPVTRLENVARGLRGPGYGPRERTHCAQGHEFTDDNILRRKSNPHARRCRACVIDESRRRRLNQSSQPLTEGVTA